MLNIKEVYRVYDFMASSYTSESFLTVDAITQVHEVVERAVFLLSLTNNG